MPNTKLIKRIHIQTSHVGDHKFCIYDIRDNSIPDHPGIRVFICSFDLITKRIVFKDMPDHGVKQKVGMPALVGSNFTDWANDETQRLP